MDFGLFSNGFRAHTSHSQTYEEDLREIILADWLGFSVCYVSEHHGEALHRGRVDTLPAPEYLMIKAAALTQQIRFGAAVKLIHLQHPVDVAVQAAVIDQMIGNNRFIFGFGTGFPAAHFSTERGLSFDDRHERILESLEFVLRCWSSEQPFDWNGKFWNGTNITALPQPIKRPHMPMAVATEHDNMIAIAGQRGYALISAFMESPAMLRTKGEKYVKAGGSVKSIAASRVAFVGKSRRQAIDDIRDGIAFETKIQEERGFLKVAKRLFGIDLVADANAVEQLMEAGFYLVGTPDEVAEGIKKFHDASGGFGTFLYVTGKGWAGADKIDASMRLFAEQVAPQLRHL